VHKAGPGQRRRSIIEVLEMNASRLLAAARYERIKVEITRAVVGLDEARHYLVEYDAKNRVSILAMVDLNIQLARHRLQDISQAMKTFGPDIQLLDMAD